MMARLIYGMNASLDGFVDHDRFGPDPGLFQHFINHMRRVSACLYGRRLYELMSYWQEDQPEWDEPLRAFAQAWRDTPKWVVSTTLTSVGPNAALLKGDLATAVQGLKDSLDGEIEVAGPKLAASLMPLGLIDEYQLYVHPVVLGDGAPFFATQPPPLKLAGFEQLGEQAVRLRYTPA